MDQYSRSAAETIMVPGTLAAHPVLGRMAVTAPSRQPLTAWVGVMRLTPCGGQVARIRWALAGSIVALVVIVPTTWAAVDTGTSDADVVFCLSPTQRPHLIDAAVALELGRSASRPDRIIVPPDRELTVDDWKHARPPGFQQACAALVGASKTFLPVPSPVPSYPKSTLWALLPVVVGAVLTGATAMVVSIWKDAAIRRRSLADALRSAALAFAEATETYLRAWISPDGNPTSAEAAVHISRFELLSAARRVSEEYRRWMLPGDLQELVSADEFGDKLTSGWHKIDNQERRVRVALVRTQLLHIDTTAEHIAKALVLPRHPRWKFLRKKSSQDRKEA